MQSKRPTGKDGIMKTPFRAKQSKHLCYFVLLLTCLIVGIPTGGWCWSLAGISSDGNIVLFDYNTTTGFAPVPGGTRSAGSAPIDVSVGKAYGTSYFQIVVLRDGGDGNDIIDVYIFEKGAWSLIARGDCGVPDAKAIGVTHTHLGEETPIIAILIDNGEDPDSFAGFEVTDAGGLSLVQEPTAFGGVFAGEYSGFSAGQIEQTGAGPAMGGDPEKLNVAMGAILGDGRNVIAYAQFRPLHLSPVYLTPAGDPTNARGQVTGALCLDFGIFDEFAMDPPDQIAGGPGNEASTIVAWWSIPQGFGDFGPQGFYDAGEDVIDVTAMQLDTDETDEIVYLSAGRIGALDVNPEAEPAQGLIPGPTNNNTWNLIKIDGKRAGEETVVNISDWVRR